MNLEKLVKEKQLELKKDLSGDYADNQGKHFEMKRCDGGYTISYGGGKKEIEVGAGQAHKLAAACRRLAAEDKKDLAEGDGDVKKKLSSYAEKQKFYEAQEVLKKIARPLNSSGFSSADPDGGLTTSFDEKADGEKYVQKIKSVPFVKAVKIEDHSPNGTYVVHAKFDMGKI